MYVGHGSEWSCRNDITIAYMTDKTFAGNAPPFLRRGFLHERGEIMIHIFDTEIAEKYGVNSAVILQNIGYWIKQNMANETNYFDGNYWTFNSRRAYKELFPYMSERQIDTAFRKLIDDGLIITGNYNKLAYDRTLWYALTQKGECILHFDGMDSVNMSNGLGQNVKPIPNINTNINADVNTDIIYDVPQAEASKPKTKRFTPPSVEDVRAYCEERQNNVDAERFVDYYSSKGWTVGRSKMKDWKAAVRNWERNSNQKQTDDGDPFIAFMQAETQRCRDKDVF